METEARYIESAANSQHQRPIGFIALCTLTFVVSAGATVYFCYSMCCEMEMPGGWTMSMMWMRISGQTWLASAAMFLLMWLAMMVAMMLPSALPMLLRCHRSVAMRQTTRAGFSTLLVACGYFGVWIAIGIVAYGIGVEWALATMRSASLSRLVPALTGTTLLLAGAFQFTRWKMSALNRCRDSHACRLTKGGSQASLSQGFREGVSCAICCSSPMLVLLVLGAMKAIVMLVVTVFIALEKLLANPKPVVRLAGIVAIVAGIAVIARSLPASEFGH